MKCVKKPLTFEEIFLIHIYTYPLMPIVERYNTLGLNKHQGHKLRTSLLAGGFITLESIPTSSGRVKLMVLTEKGAEWLRKRGFYSRKSDKEGGILHQYWKTRLQEQFRKKGFLAETEVSLGANKAADLVVSKKKSRIGVEVETGKNNYEKIIGNIRKYQGRGVVSFILDARKVDKVKEQVGETQNIAVVSDEQACFEAVIEMLEGDAI